jgi:hypothetical protein
LQIDLKELYERISLIEIPEIPLSNIFLRKKQEVIDKLYFLESFKSQNIKDLNKYTKKLY